MAIKGKLLFWLLLPAIMIAISVTGICFFSIRKTTKQNITHQLLRNDVELQEYNSASSGGEKSPASNFLPETNISEDSISHAHLRNFSILIGIAGAASAAVVVIKISRKICSSLKIITEGTKRVASGDFESPVLTDRMDSEIKELGESFNTMMNKLKESEEKKSDLFLQVKRGRDEWQATFDSVTDITTILDRNFRVIRANKAFFNNFNIDKTRLKEKKCFEVFHGADTPRLNCPLLQCAKTLKTVSEEVDDITIDGTFLVTVYPLFDEKGEFYGAVHQTKDITFQKKLLKELMKKANKLDESNKKLEKLARIVSELT